ncbi:F510_1955 family glycosylhydrolase [Exiguobacterium aurantiacum]|uniref:F510_1955 family glycosylhydrolase n=1 Tax=Exiguobacterium aurantiacum TaxID=33987 RepID=UPI00384A7EB9
MRRTLLVPTLMMTVFLASCGGATPVSESSAPVTEEKEMSTEQVPDRWKVTKAGTAVSHIHGAGFWPDGRPVIATHTGLMEFREDGWYELSSNRHDYMGFELVADGFYASGHPAQDSPYKNPLGVVRGTDKGETLEIRSLEGEADFHYMSAGFESESLYVYLETATSELEPGFYRSLDGGTSFEPMKMDGIEGRGIAGITADASEPKRVFVYGPDGILVSSDGGDMFETFNDQGNIVMMATAKGQLAYIAKTGTSFNLVVSDLTDETETTVELPSLNADSFPIELVSQDGRLLLATSDNSVYVFEDEEWTQLLQAGKVK